MIAKHYTKRNGEVMLYINDNGISQGLSSNDLSLARDNNGNYKVNWDLLEAFDDAVRKNGVDVDAKDFENIGNLKLFGFVGKKDNEFFALKAIADGFKAVKLPFKF